MAISVPSLPRTSRRRIQRRLNRHTLLSGQTVEYPNPPAPVARFLAHVLRAANDSSVSVNEMYELIFGPDNPLLDSTILPGRYMVTGETFDNPIYRIMRDQIDVKRAQLGLLDMDAVRASHTLSVPQVAKKLGITPAAVRAAIAGRRLAAIYVNGQYWIRPESVASYKVSTRGPKGKRRRVRR